MIVIPMSGLSRRFTEAGYHQPKYMLQAHGRSLFAHAVLSFQTYFASHAFRFICLDVQDTPAFVAAECAALGLARFDVVTLDAPTRGQAETVALGIDADVPVAGDTPITIFNIDTFRPGFQFPATVQNPDVAGVLEVFQGEGDNWSFVKPWDAHSDRVRETAEKRPISDLCCTGLYHFGRADDYRRIFAAEAHCPPEEWDAQELYVAPLYNRLIREGADIRYSLINRSEVIFCGVPREYDEFKNQSYSDQ